MIRTTQARAAHFILQKNHLTTPKAPEVNQLVKKIVGLPGEPAFLPFLAAHARLAHFNPPDLMTALFQNRTLIKSALMRSASYVVMAEDFVTWLTATTRQHNQNFNSEFRLWGLDPGEVTTLERAILNNPGGWPATAEMIAGRLPQHLVRELSQTSRGGRVSTTNTVALVLRWLVAKGVLGASQDKIKKVTGFRAVYLSSLAEEKLIYAPLTHWYPNLDLTAAPGEAEAQAALVQAYLAAFGPASEADISFWTGFGKSETARAVGALTAKITLTMVEGLPGMLFLLKEQAETLQSTLPPAQPLVNILPADDPFTTAYRASRSRYFADQKLQRHVFSSAGLARPTIVVNGQIVGLWQWSKETQQITWRLLAPVALSLLPLIQAELQHVAAFIQPNLKIVQEQMIEN